MPGLKKIVSSFRLGKDRQSEDVEQDVPGHLTLKRRNAKLQKRNPSAPDVDIADSGSIVEEAPARPQFARRFMRSFVSSRQNSFEPGESLNDFEVEEREAAALAGELGGSGSSSAAKQPMKPVDNSSLVSKLGLKVNTANLKAREHVDPASAISPVHLSLDQIRDRHLSHCCVPQADPDSSADSAALVDSSPVWPCTNMNNGCATAAAGSSHWTPAQGKTNGFPNAVMSQDDWVRELVSGGDAGWYEAPTDSPVTSRDLTRPETNPYRKGKAPATGPIDWSKVSEQEFAELAEAYSNVSPCDSAVAFPEDQSSIYSGKGKARAVDNEAMALAGFTEAFKDYLAERESQSQKRRQEEEARVQAVVLQERLCKEQEEAERLQRIEEDHLEALALQERFEEELKEVERLAAELARVRDCAVCGDSKESLEFPAKAPTSECEHAASTCNECLQTWMASEFDTKGCEGLKCPECPRTLEYNDVQRAASAETIEAYDKMLTRNALSSLPEFAWCLGAGCQSGQLNYENSNDSFMDCVSCGYKQCLKHKVPWHSNETCEQYEYRTSGQGARDDERATQAMLDEVSKKCPGKNCGWRIQKTDGCDHMTCRKCRYEFCWQCLASQKEIKRVGNTAHEKWCKFHSNNLEVTWPFNAH